MKQDKIRFYQTRVFRSVLAIVLAVILLTNDTVENMASLFAGEQEPAKQAEVVVPEVQMPPPAAEAPSVPAAPAGELPPPLTEVPNEQTVPEGESAPAEASPEGEPAPVEATPEASVEPGEGAEETPTPAPQPEGDPLALAIAQFGASYAYVSGDLFSGQKLKEKDLLGSLNGIAVVTACIEANDEANQPSAIQVHYYNAQKKAMQSGYMDRGSATELNYEETVEGFAEEEELGQYQPGWPLTGAEFLPAEKEDKPAAAPEIMAFGLGLEGLEGEFGPQGDPQEGYVTASFYNWEDDTNPLHEISVEIGTFASYEGPVPTRSGYTFASWYPDPATTPLTEDTRFVAQFKPDSDKVYQVVIYYHFENGSEAAKPFVATLAQGETYSVISPSVQGFTTDDTEAVISGTITEASELSTVIYVKYLPSTGTNYTVRHYRRKVGATIGENDRYDIAKYDLADTDNLNATTGAEVVVTPKTYTGFSPLEDQQLSHHIAADGSTVINVFYTRNIYAIYFKAAGGSYVDPIIKEYGATITAAEKAKVSTRTGYDFNGWDKTIPNTMDVDGDTLTAKWTAKTAAYTLVYWLENVAGDGYVYDRTAQRSGTSGTVITLSAADRISIPYFTYHSYQTDMTIAGDGSTVVNVYYSRNSYTVIFAWSGSSTGTPNSGTTIRLGGVTVATYTNASSPTYSFTAKYQADISQLWPSGSDVVTTGNQYFTGWATATSGGTTYVSKRVNMVSELCGTTNNTLTVYGSWSTAAYTDYLHYMFECIDPADPDGVNYTNGGVTRRYKEDPAYSQAATSSNSTTNWSAKAIEGLTSVVVVTNAGSGGYRNHVYFYYSRNTYKLEFFNYNTTDKTFNIMYGAPFADKEYTPTRPSGVDTTWTFQGWYTTKDCYPDSKFIWSAGATMPFNNLTLYALWAPPTYTVKYFATSSAGAETQYASQTVTSGQYAAAPATNPTRIGYNFVDWSLRGSGVPFQFDTQQIVGNVELVARWVAREDLSYTVNYWQVGAGWQPGDATGNTRVSGITPNPKTVPNNRTASTVFEEAPVVSGFVPDLVNKSIVLTGDPAKDVIDFCYKPYTVLEYRVNYVDTGNNPLLPQKVVTDETENAIIEYAPTIPGYTPSKLYVNMRLGSDSSANIITFVYTANPSAAYKVEHYFMNLSTGKYNSTPDETESLSAPTGLKVTATAKVRTGYALDAANSASIGYVQKDGSLVLKMYYKRTTIGWTVYHYRKGTTTTLAAADTGAMLLGLALTASPKTIAGYEYHSASPASQQITIQTDPAKNVIYMYYRPANVLEITKTASKARTKVGDEITFTVTVKNTSTENLTGVTATDPLMGSAWNIGALAAGGSVTETYPYTVIEADAYKGVVHNTVTVRGKDPIGDDVSGSAECNVPVSAFIVTKTSDKAQAAVGETIAYTVTVKNAGSKPLTNVVAKDPLMGGDWIIGTLPAGKSEPKTYAYTVQPTDADKAYVHNTVVVTGKDSNGEDDGGEAEHDVQIKATISVGAEKTVTGAGAPKGENFTFTLTGSSGAPMPSGSVGQTKTATGPEGPIDFGKIDFGAVGTYTYTVRETAGSKEGFTYDGTVYTMTVTVTETAGKLSASPVYTKDGAPVDKMPMTFTNTYLIPTQTITVTKTWSDSNNAGGVRPDSVKMQLYREAGGSAPVAVGSVKEMTSTGNWTVTFPGVDKHDTDGNTYTYSVMEVDPPKNYDVAYGGSGINLTVTNTIRYIPVTGNKVWNIIGSGYTKQGIIVDLYRNDNASAYVATQPVSGGSTTGTGTVTWPFSFPNMLEYDKDGEKFTYTAKERVVPDGIVVDYSGTTITNTYPADRELTIRVEWDYTAGAPAHEKHANATVNLLRNGAAYQNNIIIPQTAGIGETTLTVPPLTYDGHTFTVIGAPVTNYTVSYPADPIDPVGTKVVRYTYVMPTKDITGTKGWEKLPEGFVKPIVEINLWRKIATDATATEVLPSVKIPSGGSTYTFKDQPLYDTNGNEYLYSVTETPLTGFASVQDGLKFTNTYVPSDYAIVRFEATKSVTTGVGAPADQTFTFTLTADSPADAHMPSGVTGNTASLTLPAGPVNFGDIVFEYPGTYTYTMKETPATVEGFTFDPRVYTIRIVVTDPLNDGKLEYTASVVDQNNNPYEIDKIVFENLYAIPEHDSKTSQLTWVDDSDDLGGRPGSVQIQLYRKAQNGGTEEAVGAPKTISAAATGNVWTYTFTDDLLKHDTQGRTYDYYVKQVTAVPNYAWAQDADDPMNLTDTLSTTQVSGNKVWSISSGATFSKPAAGVKIELYRNGGATAYRTQTVAAVNGSDTWPFTFEKLLKFDPDGEPYTYTVKEIEVLPGVDVDDTDQANYTIINKVGDDEPVKVRVDWDYTGAPLGDRPTEVDVELYRSDNASAYFDIKNDLTGSVTGSSASWPHTFLVPQGKYRGYTFTAKGEALGKYTKTEYKDSVTGELVIKYAYIMPKMKVAGTKSWPGLPATITKPEVTINLYRNGVWRDKTTIPSGGSGYAFPDLDTYDPQGNPYDYTVTEDDLPGFDSVQTGDNFANTYNPVKATATVKGEKKIIGDTGYPAATEFKFKLTAQGGAPMPDIGTVGSAKTIDAPKGDVSFGDITYSLPGVYNYTIEELPHTNTAFTVDTTVYTLKVTVVQNGNRLEATQEYSAGSTTDTKFTFTNTYTVPKQGQKAIKKWADSGNALGLRPSSVALRLYRKVEGGAPESVGSPANVTGTMTGTADWEYIFANMPIHDPSGTPYIYSVEEENVDDNYRAESSGMTVTNTLLEDGVSITKTAVPAPQNESVAANVRVGDVITYTIAVRNTGARSVYNVRVLDQVPLGLTVTGVSPATASSNGSSTSGTNLMWVIPEIQKSQTATITVQAKVDALPANVTERDYVNYAYVRLPDGTENPVNSAQPDDPDDQNHPYTSTLTPVMHQVAQIIKTATPAGSSAQDDTALVEGQTVTYTISMTNKQPAAGVTISDQVPAGMTLVPGSITTTGATNGTYNSATRTITWPSQGYPKGLVKVSFQATVDKFTAAEMASNLTVKTLENTAEVAYARPGMLDETDSSNTVKHTATRREFSVAKTAALVVGGTPQTSYDTGLETAPIEAELGQEIQYKIDVNVKGYMPTTRGSIVIEDTLHKDVAFVPGSTVITPSSLASRLTVSGPVNGKLTWTLSSLDAADQNFSITFRAKAPATSDDASTPAYETVKVFSNTATVTDNALKNLVIGATTAKVYPEAEHTRTSLPTWHAVYEPMLSGSKTSNPLSPLANGNTVVLQKDDLITYTITVENPGNSEARKVRVMDILPEGVDFDSASSPMSGVTGPLQLTNAEGRTVLMWQVDELARAVNKEVVPAGRVQLEVTVKVKDPAKALVIANTAYYRLPENETDAFPLVSGQPDSIAGYLRTNQKVQHQVYTLAQTSTIAGGATAPAAVAVKPGDAITYTITLNAAADIKGVVVSDALPSGLAPALGSIQIVHANGSTVNVPDAAYNSGTRTLTWPSANVTAGATQFRFTAIVEPLTGAIMNRSFANLAIVTMDNGAGVRLSDQTNTLYHKTSVGYNTIDKQAELFVGGVGQGVDNGSAASPVVAERGQEVQYTLTVNRAAGVGNVSGNIAVLDPLPKGMTIVPGSLNATFSSGGSLVGSGATTLTGVDGVTYNAAAFLLNNMANGSVATLTFKAYMPDFADDPDTPEVETLRLQANQAYVIDEDMLGMAYSKAVSGHAAGQPLYGEDDFVRFSNETFHLIRGAALESIKTADIPAGARVYADDIITYTIAITNSGAIDAKNVLVRDTIPAGMEYVAGTATSTAAGTVIGQIGDTVTWIIPEISVGDTVTVTLKAKVLEMEGLGIRLFKNVAMVRETTPNGNPGDEIKEEGENPTPSTPTDHFQLNAGSIVVNKTDSYGEPLEGAEITLKQLSTIDPHVQFDTWTAVTNEDGEVVFDDVPIGQYAVYESEAPEGYILNQIRRSVNMLPTDAERSVTIVNYLLEDNAVPNVGAGSRCVGDSAN